MGCGISGGKAWRAGGAEMGRDPLIRGAHLGGERPRGGLRRKRASQGFSVSGGLQRPGAAPNFGTRPFAFVLVIRAARSGC